MAATSSQDEESANNNNNNDQQAIEPDKKAKQTAKPFWYGVVNKEWLPLKFFFFFKYGAMGAILPFFVVYYRARKLTPSQIGLIECLVPFIGILARAFSAAIADKTQKHRLVLTVSLLLFTLFTASLAFVREPTDAKFPTYPTILHCSGNNNLKIQACNSSALIWKKVSYYSQTVSVSRAANLHKSFSRKPAVVVDDCSSPEDSSSCHLRCETSHHFKSFKISLAHGEEGDNLCSMVDVQLEPNSNPGHHLCLNESQLSFTFCQLDCHCSQNRSSIDVKATDEGLYIDAKSDLTRGQMFSLILTLRLLASIFFASTFSLEDSLTYDILGPDNRMFWGQQKMFGPLSLGIIACLVGILVDATKTFNTAFYIFGGLNISAALVTFLWIRQPKLMDGAGSNSVKRPKTNFAAAIGQLCRLPLFSITCLVAIASGVFVGIVFIIWPQWVLFLGASNSLIGITTVTGSCVEASGLFLAGQFVAKVGNIVCFILMFVAYAIRFLLYSFLTSNVVWLTIPLEFAQFFCFSFFLAALTQFAAVIAPKGMSATTQAIFQACYFGVGLGVGNLASGATYERLGGWLAFKVFSAVASICFVMLLILHLAYLRKIPIASNDNAKETKSMKNEGSSVQHDSSLQRNQSKPLISPNQAE